MMTQVQTKVDTQQARAIALEVDTNVTQSFLSGANNPTPNQIDSQATPVREPLKHLLIGSPKAVTSTIHYLQVIGYADVGNWSPLARTSNPGEVMSMLNRPIVVQ